MKIIVGPNGPFVAMPSRKLTSHCQGCGCKNPIRANFCNQCGGKVTDGHKPRDDDGRLRLYADIAHPINARCREMIQQRIVEEYEAEIVRSKEPGYVSRYDDPDEDHRGGHTERDPRVLRETCDAETACHQSTDPTPARDDDFGAGIL
jgi:stage V sporulation protein G